MVERSDYSLADLARLSGQDTVSPRQGPLGFYAASLKYELRFQDTPETPNCLPGTYITVEIALIDRRIQIGYDLINNACMFEGALNRYRRMANAEVVVFDQLIGVIEAALKMEVAHAQSLTWSRTDRYELMEAVVRRVIEPFDKVRLDAKSAAAIPHEVKDLWRSCPQQP
jgi:hypothetical protein